MGWQSLLHGKMNLNIPDGRVTKLITHADTLNTESLTMQEDDCRNQRIKISWERFKQNNKGEDKRSFYDNPELIRNPYTKKNYSMSLTRKLKINLSAKRVEPFSQP